MSGVGQVERKTQDRIVKLFSIRLTMPILATGMKEKIMRLLKKNI